MTMLFQVCASVGAESVAHASAAHASNDLFGNDRRSMQVTPLKGATSVLRERKLQHAHASLRAHGIIALQRQSWR
jgi:hypothetical protein